MSGEGEVHGTMRDMMRFAKAQCFQSRQRDGPTGALMQKLSSR